MNKSGSGFREDNTDVIHSSSSMIARVGQIMAMIITLGVVVMISSMLVSESLSGDAAQINRAGALRMQAVRISRASQVDMYALKQKGGEQNPAISEPISTINKEIINFEQRLSRLFEGGVTRARDDLAIEMQYQRILNLWQELVKPDQYQTIQSFDDFVLEIDQLVTLLQSGSEKKLALLRLIQGISLFTLVIIAFVVISSVNRMIVIPLKQLVTVAEHAGKGDFSIKATYDADNELGVLARTINRMSEELELTYQDYEQRVDSKTKALTHSNRSLQVLYQAASLLASNEEQQTDKHIVRELQAALGIGTIKIERTSLHSNGQQIDTVEPSTDNNLKYFKRLEFPLQKPGQHYGYIVWHLPQQKQAKTWQTQMLQAMADIVATAMDLEQRRHTENRLLIVEERAVIARELHDSLAQSLSYLKVQMSLLTRKMHQQADKENIDETIADIKQGINAAYQQLRELLTTFRLKLDNPSLSNALQGTVVEFAEKCQHQIDLEFLLTANSLSANQEIHVLQIIREALSNVHRHAKAERAGVVLKQQNGKHQVEIWDDGIGIDNLQQKQGHFGLGIMQERAKSLHTVIAVKSRVPKGTRIIFEF